MARLFISYANQDRATAERLVQALIARDHEVWWDRELAGGEAFRRTIEQQVKQCEVLIVIWSENSAGSHWVLDEVDKAVSNEKLLPVTFEAGIPVPMGFGQFHVLDFSAWNGDVRAPVLEDLDNKITEILHGNFRNAILEIGRRAGEKSGGRTAAMLLSSVGSNVGGLPVLRLVAGAVAAGGGLALLQTVVGVFFNGGVFDYVFAAAIYIFAFLVLRMAHQPVALRLGRGRRFFDDAFTFWLMFCLLTATLYMAAMRFFGDVSGEVFVGEMPALAMWMLTGIVFLRLGWTALSFLMRKV
ncbi:MAG: toll/interleukin-1 receptor domain-containing protein [Phycisphaerales bacterium]|nr:toll/interleukin-1 receptor domain-containing protein [Hyphomonadaceae bacterium]